jgi:hypothetical protein
VFTLLLHERSTREPKSEREKGREGKPETEVVAEPGVVAGAPLPCRVVD